MIGIGPKDKWEHDLEKMSRAALAATVIELHCRLALYSSVSIFSEGFDRNSMERILDTCKKYGKWDNQAKRHARFMADPAKFTDEFIRRQKAAKAAARRKKSAAKKFRIDPKLAAISNSFSRRWEGM